MREVSTGEKRGSRPGTVPRRRLRWIPAAILLVLSAGCAAPGSDIHLAPLYTRMNTGDGGIEHEMLGGLYRQRRDAASGRFESATLGPLWSLDVEEDGDWTSHFLVPLGRTTSRVDGATSVLFPVYYWRRILRENGSEEWGLIALPGLLMRNRDDRGTEVGWFPLFGRFEDFMTFDDLWFILWPLYVHSKRGERVANSIVWPIVWWTSGGGSHGVRLFPLYGRYALDGRFDRYFVLWPIGHWQRNHLGGGGEEPELAWWIFPLLGRKERGTFRATTVLWPFFGYSHDPRSGFWAWDGPWPLVRFQRGPGEARHTRLWPLYSFTRGDGLESTSYLWPIIRIRRERSAFAERDSVFVVPLWQSWNRTDLETGERSSWAKLFPLFQHERIGEWDRGSFPTLDPFWKNELYDRHFSWMWKLFEWEEEGEMRRERSLLGLWMRERDAGEDRASLSGIWSRRKYTDGGRPVKETSLLFGLLRWRVTEGDGFDMLAPAFPGPGWPATRRRAETNERGSMTHDEGQGSR